MFKKLTLSALFSVASLTAYADTTTTLNVGPLPTALTYSDSFASASIGTTFFDDFIFTIPNGNVNSVTSSITMDTIFGLTNLRARVYTGNTHQTGAVVPGTLISGWSTTVNYSPTVSVSTVVLDPVTLNAGTYTLQVTGNVAGLAGGSYSGVLNVAAVPEPETYPMMLAGLGMIGCMARRKKKS